MARLPSSIAPEIKYLPKTVPNKGINTNINIIKVFFNEKYILIVQLSAAGSPPQAPKFFEFFGKMIEKTPPYFLKISIEGGGSIENP